MRATTHIPVRFPHSDGANFTPLILKKAVRPELLPFSLKEYFKEPMDVVGVRLEGVGVGAGCGQATVSEVRFRSGSEAAEVTGAELSDCLGEVERFGYWDEHEILLIHID
jgi:hypothetical protein